MVPTAIGTGDLGGATVSLVTTTETVAISSGSVPMPNEVTLVVVVAFAAWTAGTGTTAMQMRLRRGTAVTSPQIGQTVTHAATAGAGNSGVQIATDQIANGYTQQYSFTLAQVGATANGSITSATILVITF